MAPLNTASAYEPVDLEEAITSYTNAIDAMTSHVILRIVLRTHQGTAITTAVFIVPALCREAAHLRTRLALARLDHANLIAAARATLTADHEGERDPLWYLRDELAAHGQPPMDPWRRA